MTSVSGVRARRARSSCLIWACPGRSHSGSTHWRSVWGEFCYLHWVQNHTHIYFFLTHMLGLFYFLSHTHTPVTVRNILIKSWCRHVCMFAHVHTTRMTRTHTHTPKTLTWVKPDSHVCGTTQQCLGMKACRAVMTTHGFMSARGGGMRIEQYTTVTLFIAYLVCKKNVLFCESYLVLIPQRNVSAQQHISFLEKKIPQPVWVRGW